MKNGDDNENDDNEGNDGKGDHGRVHDGEERGGRNEANAGDEEDVDLVRRWQGGDNGAADTLLRRYFKVLRGFFRNTTAEPDQEDLIQATFLGCLQNIDEFRNESSFRVFLLSIAYRKLMDHYRKRSRSLEDLDPSKISVADLDPSPSSVVARRHEEAIVLQALRQIPIEDQLLLELYLWEDLSASEVGKVLGLGEGAVRGRLRRAYKRLKKEIERLTKAPEERKSTLDDFERWAERIRKLPPGNDEDEADDEPEK